MKTLAKEFGWLSVEKLGNNFTIVEQVSSGWTQTTPNGQVCVSRKYIDLAGMSIEDKTLFFTGATTQNTLPPSATPSVAGAVVQVIDCMTTKPLTDTDCDNICVVGNISANPSAQTLTFDQTIYMRMRVFNIDIDHEAGGYFVPISDEQLGSLEPTASDRVYCTRIVLLAEAMEDGNYTVYGARYLLQANAKEEPEYQYLMRLKRSYELQNEPDRD